MTCKSITYQLNIHLHYDLVNYELIEKSNSKLLVVSWDQAGDYHLNSAGWVTVEVLSLSLSLSLSLGQFWPVRFLLLLLPATNRSRPGQIESQKSKICFSNFFCRLVITYTRWSVLPKTPDSSECKDQSLVVSHFYRPLQATANTNVSPVLLARQATGQSF